MQNEINNNPELDPRSREALLSAFADTQAAITSGDKTTMIALASQFATWEQILEAGISETTTSISQFEQVAGDDPVVPALSDLANTFAATRPIVAELREMLDGEISTVLA